MSSCQTLGKQMLSVFIDLCTCNLGKSYMASVEMYWLSYWFEKLHIKVIRLEHTASWHSNEYDWPL